MERDNPIRLETSWRERVGEYLSREDMQALAAFLRERQAAGARIHPPPGEMFAAFDATPFLKPGKANVIAIRGYDAFGAGGLWRPCALYTD